MSLANPPWVRGAELQDWDALNARLGELEDVLRELHQRIANGPVPGAYLPFSIHRPGSVAAAAGIWRLRMPIELRPVLVSVGVRSGSGEVTVQLLDDGANLLVAPLTTVSGLASIRSRSSFATEKIAADSIFQLDVIGISGAPTDLSALLVVKDVGKIEPA